MVDSTDRPFLDTERRKTNKSLRAARDRTDESLERRNRETEDATDESVRASRKDAQREKSESRQRTDRRLDFDGDSQKAGSPLGEPEKSEALLLDERERMDRERAQERARVDAAIERERLLHRKMMHDLLGREREQTDQNLMDERSQTDKEVQRVTGLLTNEVATHLKTKAALTTRDEFLAIVSHDLRNPIGAILSCSEMLLEDSLTRKLDDESRHWIEFIRRNSETALRLIGDLLDIERIAQGKLNLNIGVHSISQLIRESIESFAAVASARNILLRSGPHPEMDPIICDRDRILQVLSNLISNALKFTGEGGRVIVEARRKGENILVCICDNGTGIPKENQRQIFERFAQISSKDRNGLGLGLYISKMLIEAHQGAIWVESEPGRGSTFQFIIPVRGPVRIDH